MSPVIKARIIELRKLNHSFKEIIAFIFVEFKYKVNRNQIAGIVFKAGLNKPRPKPANKSVKKNPNGRAGSHHSSWSENALTEPWAEYTARKKAERASQRHQEPVRC